MQIAKRAYVATIRGAGAALDSASLLQALERRRDSRLCLYLASLFSIYDAERLTRLDLPWWTFAAAEHVVSLLAGGTASAFEYGSGASTVWLARRCRSVHSIEHDGAWAEVTRKLCAPYGNVSVQTVLPEPVDATTWCRSDKAPWTELSFDRYVQAIHSVPGRFDLIVIDGRCRSECLAEARSKLNPGGAIVFDDSHRRRYRAALDQAPMARKIHRGLVPGLPYPGETSVLTYRA